MDSELEDIQKWVSLIKDFLTVLAALGALYGLRTWRKQIKDKTEYEAARRLLKAIYKVRNAMSNARNNYPFSFDTEAALREAGIEPKKPITFLDREGIRAVYMYRLNKLSEAIAELNEEEVEAEILRIKNFDFLLKGFHVWAESLRYSMDVWYNMPGKPEITDDNKEIYDELERTVKDQSIKSDFDPFSIQVDSYINTLEKKLKPFLKIT